MSCDCHINGPSSTQMDDCGKQSVCSGGGFARCDIKTPEPLFNLFHDIFISAVPNNIKNLLEHVAAYVDRSKSLQGPCGTAVTAIAPVCALNWQKPGTVQLMFRLHLNRTRCIRCSIVSVYCCNIVCLTLLEVYNAVNNEARPIFTVD